MTVKSSHVELGTSYIHTLMTPVSMALKTSEATSKLSRQPAEVWGEKLMQSGKLGKKPKAKTVGKCHFKDVNWKPWKSGGYLK